MILRKQILLQMYAINYILAFFIWFGSMFELTINTWFALLISLNVMYCALWWFWIVNKHSKDKLHKISKVKFYFKKYTGKSKNKEI